jgi:hypothetical protein
VTDTRISFEDLPLSMLNDVAEYAYAADADVTIVDFSQDGNPEHGTNSQSEMIVSTYEPD